MEHEGDRDWGRVGMKKSIADVGGRWQVDGPCRRRSLNAKISERRWRGAAGIEYRAAFVSLHYHLLSGISRSWSC